MENKNHLFMKLQALNEQISVMRFVVENGYRRPLFASITSH